MEMNVEEGGGDLTCHGKPASAHRAEAHQQVQEGAALGLHPHMDRGQVIHEPDGRQAHVALGALSPVLRDGVLAGLGGLP